jgi:hypothetical protein
MSYVKAYALDPNAKKDYQIDWADFLSNNPSGGADTLLTSAWFAPIGLTASSPSNTTTTATVWLEVSVSGSKGNEYLVTNHITTAGGRSEDRSILIRVSEQ